MRAVLFLAQVFGSLAVLASNVNGGIERDIHDRPVAPTPDIFGDGTALYEQWPQLGSVPVNRTEGSIRSGKRQFNNLLESRQNSVSSLLHGFHPTLFGSTWADLVSGLCALQACLDPGYILVCPVTDPFPCCDPKFPICTSNRTGFKLETLSANDSFQFVLPITNPCADPNPCALPYLKVATPLPAAPLVPSASAS